MLGGPRVVHLGPHRVRLARKLLRDEIQPFADERIAGERLVHVRDVALQAHELLMDVRLFGDGGRLLELREGEGRAGARQLPQALPQPPALRRQGRGQPASHRAHVAFDRPQLIAHVADEPASLAPARADQLLQRRLRSHQDGLLQPLGGDALLGDGQRLRQRQEMVKGHRPLEAEPPLRRTECVMVPLEQRLINRHPPLV